MKSPGASDCLGVSLSAPRWNGNGGSWFQWGKNWEVEQLKAHGDDSVPLTI